MVFVHHLSHQIYADRELSEPDAAAVCISVPTISDDPLGRGASSSWAAWIMAIMVLRQRSLKSLANRLIANFLFVGLSNAYLLE